MALTKKKMLTKTRAATGTNEAATLKGKELVEWRRMRVAQGMLAHKSVRQIQTELALLAEEGMGKQCSTGTVGNDMKAVRALWATERKQAVEELVAEDLVRLRELEKRWWDEATGKGEEAGEASERVMAIMRQRAALLWMGMNAKPAVQVTAGAMASAGSGGVNESGPLPAGAQVKVLIEYVDDRRDLGKFG